MISLQKDKKGAVAVEFVVAVMPLFIIFFSLIQLAVIYVADLGVKHAAVVVVRAAVVVKTPWNPEGDGTVRPAFKGGDGAGIFLFVANEALLPWVKKFQMAAYKADVTYSGEPFDPVTSKVDAAFLCKVPLGRRTVCRKYGGILYLLHGTATLAHQGAKYSP